MARPSAGRLLLGIALVIAAVFAGRHAAGLLPRLAAWVQDLGAWGPSAFALGYVVATVALVPGSLLTLAAGAIFGIVKGTALVLIAATLGASLAFLISRYLAREAVERRLAAHPRFAAIDRAVGSEGRKIVFLLRLSPIFPFNLLNYGLGLTNIRFTDFLVASAGMVPGILLYVYCGRVIGDVARIASGASASPGPAGFLVLGIGLVATIAVTTLITRTARRALRAVTDVEPRTA